MFRSIPRPSFAPAAAALPRAAAHERVAALIRRYPDLSAAQLAELAANFPRLKAVDVALMTADERLAPRLEAFCAANRELMSPSLSDYLVIAAIMAFPLLAVVLLTFAG